MKQAELDLFAAPTCREPLWLGRQAVVLYGFALAYVDVLLPELRQIIRAAPFRHMLTPGGKQMQVALTNCGSLGWVSDRHGYRYSSTDPHSGQAWPALPASFCTLAALAAEAAGFAAFIPDACLVNCYVPGNRLSLHQDRDEQDYAFPIVSVSLGLPANFQFGGLERSDRTQRVGLLHGDVVVWGGEDRLRFHGVLPLKPGEHPRLGSRRINLTFRKAAAHDTGG